MKKGKFRFAPVANLVIAKPIQQIEMKTLVEAAKLFIDGKTGDDAFAYVHRKPLAYKFVQPDFEKPRTATLMQEWQTWQAAGILFGQKFEECPDKEHLLPYLLIMLCGDLLDNKAGGPVSYSSEDCGYAEEDGVITIKLSKEKDYCSYHNITATFSKSGFDVVLDGCWYGSHQDPGPVNHPTENCYKARVLYEVGNARVCTDSGLHPIEAFALWGIDLNQAKAAINEAEQATA